MILRLKLSNWGIITNQEFKFSKGKNLILGPNFSGKSSILNAIYFAITGALPSNLPPGEMVQKRESEAFVEMDFSTPNGETYRVRRRIGKGRKTAHANLYLIGEGEEKAEVETGGGEVTQAILDKLGIGEKYLLQAIFMREGDIYRTLTKPERGFKEELNKLLKVNRLSELAKAVKKIKGEIKKEIENLETKLVVTQGEEERKSVKDLEKQLEEIKKELEELNQKLTKIEEERENLRELEMSVDEALALDRKIAKLKDRYNEILSDSEVESLEEIVQQVKDKENKLNEINEKITELKSIINSRKLEKEKIERDIQRLEEGIMGKRSICPTCEKPLTEAEARNVIRKKKKEISRIESDIKSRENKLESELRNIKQIQEKLSILKENKAILEGLNREIEELERKKRSITESITEPIEEVEKKIEELERKTEEIDDKREKLIYQRGQLEGMLTSQRDFERDILSDLKKLYHKQHITEIILKAAEETAKDVAQRALEGVKKDVKTMWTEIHSGTWDIEFDDKKLLPIIKTKNNEKFVVEQLSGAEKVTLFVALRISFARNLGNPGFLIFDEPFEHLDDRNKKLLREVLSKISSTWINQVIVSSYEEDVKEDKWDNIIELEAK